MSPRRDYLLGIDVGTSGLKCALVDLDGHILASALREYVPNMPQVGWAEQNPDVWVEAAISAMREVVKRGQVNPADVQGIGLCGQMHSTVFLDAHGSYVRPAILWLDSRSVTQIEKLKKKVGLHNLTQWIGNPVMPGFMLSSLLWLQEADAESWDAVRHVMLAKDYVRYCLTGSIATDFSDASSTALLNVRAREWCRELLDVTGIPANRLPILAESTHVVGTLRREMSDIIGLQPGVPVVCGAGDQEAQAVGNGIIRPGVISCTIGTGGQIFYTIDHYKHDDQLRLHTFCHAVPGVWHWEAATLTAGMSFRWLRDEVLGYQHSYEELAEAAATVMPGAEGLLFLPYLAGERTPHMDPSARGVFYGLTLRHTWQHMARAIMEGVIFSLLDGVEIIRQLGGSIEQVIASGGGAQHPLWLQLQADIFALEVKRASTQEAAALGAALLAGVGAGVYPDLETACHDAVTWYNAVVQPRPEFTGVYAEIAARYRSLSNLLLPRFQGEYGPRHVPNVSSLATTG